MAIISGLRLFDIWMVARGAATIPVDFSQSLLIVIDDSLTNAQIRGVNADEHETTFSGLCFVYMT